MNIHKPLSKKITIISLAVFSLLVSFLVIYILVKTFATSMGGPPTPASYIPTGKGIERISGPDRFATAAGISNNQYPVGSTDRVIITTGENWPDAATAPVLAKAYRAPILLTNTASINLYAAGEIRRLNPKYVTILGGINSVSETNVNNIRAIVPNAQIDRISGADRYEVAAKIAERVYTLNGNKINDSTAFFVTGDNYPDVLSVAPVAAAKGYPIFYMSTTMPQETIAMVRKLGITRSIVVGGINSVPEGVRVQLPGSFRLSSTDRYQTNMVFNDWAIMVLPGITFSNIAIASGETFPDALTAAPYIASLSNPGVIVLSPPTNNDSQTKYIFKNIGKINQVYVFGGKNSITSTTYTILSSYIGVPSADQVYAQNLVDRYISYCPSILNGTIVRLGPAKGYQSISYYTDATIELNPTHSATVSTIIGHEIYHVYDWRDNNKINWGESIPPYPKPACMPSSTLR